MIEVVMEVNLFYVPHFRPDTLNGLVFVVKFLY